MSSLGMALLECVINTILSKANATSSGYYRLYGRPVARTRQQLGGSLLGDVTYQTETYGIWGAQKD